MLGGVGGGSRKAAPYPDLDADGAIRVRSSLALVDGVS